MTLRKSKTDIKCAETKAFDGTWKQSGFKIDEGTDIRSPFNIIYINVTENQHPVIVDDASLEKKILGEKNLPD